MNCKTCGKEIGEQIKYYRGRKLLRTYCCRKCYDTRGAVWRREPLTERTCLECNTVFMPVRSDSVVCPSEECHNKRSLKIRKVARCNRLAVLTKMCKICQNPFFPHLAGRRTYCDKECARVGKLQNMRRYSERMSHDRDQADQ